MTSNLVSQIIPELASIGLSYPQWQDALEAAYASGKLTVAGEVHGGQVLQYNDASGAGLTVLAAPPYGSFAGYAAPGAFRRASGHVSMIDSIIGVVDIVADNPMLQVSAQAAPVTDSFTATVAQGPMIAEQDPLEYQPLSIAALATDVRIYEDAASFAQAGGTTVGSVESTGLRDMNSGASAPHAHAQISAEVSEAELLTNQLTGQKFWAATVTQPFEYVVTIPADHPDLTHVSAGTSPFAKPGTIISGKVQMAAHINDPAVCDSGGGCGCGDCGCGN